jgi:hypothetical protein
LACHHERKRQRGRDTEERERVREREREREREDWPSQILEGIVRTASSSCAAFDEPNRWLASSACTAGSGWKSFKKASSFWQRTAKKAAALKGPVLRGPCCKLVVRELALKSAFYVHTYIVMDWIGRILVFFDVEIAGLPDAIHMFIQKYWCSYILEGIGLANFGLLNVDLVYFYDHAVYLISIWFCS